MDPTQIPEGLYFDEDTGIAWDLKSGYAYDPASATLVDQKTGIHYDLQTREEIPADQVASSNLKGGE